MLKKDNLPRLVAVFSVSLLAASTVSGVGGGTGAAPRLEAVAALQPQDGSAAAEAEVLPPIRDDLPILALAVIMTTVGTAAVAMAGVYWIPSGRLLLPFGLFTLLYGLRLFGWAASAEVLFGGTPLFWRGFNAFLTYVIPVPGIAFFEQFFGRGWKSLIRRMFEIQLIYAVGAIAYDAWNLTPYSAEGPYRVIVIMTSLVAAAHMFGRGKMDRGFKILRAGYLAFLALALNATLVGAGVLPWEASAEPLGFLVFVVSLGYAAADRFFLGQKQLIQIDRELETAQRIQASILPAKMPEMAGMSLSVRYLPAAAVAGDIYDFLIRGERALAVLVADVSGHGVPAALIASMVKVAFSSQMDRAAHPEQVLSAINRILCGNLRGQFVTAACLYLDLERRFLRYSTAGHPPLLCLRSSSERVQEIHIDGIFMGVLPAAEYVCREIPIEPNDRFVVYTDGVVEASGHNGALFGKERLIELIESSQAQSAEALSERIIERVRRWKEKASPADAMEDDLTLLIVDLRGS